MSSNRLRLEYPPNLPSALPKSAALRANRAICVPLQTKTCLRPLIHPARNRSALPQTTPVLHITAPANHDAKVRQTKNGRGQGPPLVDPAGIHLGGDLRDDCPRVTGGLREALVELRAASFLLLRKERAHRVEVDSEVFLHGTRP